MFERFLNEVYGISWGYFDNNFEGSYLDEAYTRYERWLEDQPQTDEVKKELAELEEVLEEYFNRF